jgi:hypothetical protein
MKVARGFGNTQVFMLFLEIPDDSSPMVQAYQAVFVRLRRTESIRRSKVAGAEWHHWTCTATDRSRTPYSLCCRFSRLFARRLSSGPAESERIRCILESLQWEAAFGDVIHLPFIHAEQTFPFFPNEHDGRRPSSIWLLFYSPPFYVLHHFIHFSMRESTRWLTKRTHFACVDAMVNSLRS